MYSQYGQLQYYKQATTQMQAELTRLIDLIQTVGSFVCRILQKVLVVLIFFLFGLFAYIYLQYLFRTRANQQKQSNLFKIVYLALGVILLYNLIYNFVMANRVGPGFSQNISRKLLDKHQVTKRCRKCQKRKPTRTHHCSVCDKCIVQMDHHCPWMGTCIGHQNRRYFIRFLTYLDLAVVLVIKLIIAMDLPRGQVYMFMFTLSLVLGAFALYHWIIILWGRTTLQFCQILDGYKPSKSISTNFKIVFGTKNILLALLPIHIPLGYAGCQWNQAPQVVIQVPLEQDQSSFVPNQ